MVALTLVEVAAGGGGGGGRGAGDADGLALRSEPDCWVTAGARGAKADFALKAGVFGLEAASLIKGTWSESPTWLFVSTDARDAAVGGLPCDGPTEAPL